MTEQYVLRVRQGEKAEQLLEAEGLEFCKEAPGAFLVEIQQEAVPPPPQVMISQRSYVPRRWRVRNRHWKNCFSCSLSGTSREGARANMRIRQLFRDSTP